MPEIAKDKKYKKANQKLKKALYLPKYMNVSQGNYVVPSGFEPELTEPKSVVLPLHHGTIFVKGSAKVIILSYKAK